MVPLNSSSAMNHNTSIQTINESQISSPDNSEMSFENVRKNTLLKGTNNNEDSKQKTILLKIPSMTESDLLVIFFNLTAPFLYYLINFTEPIRIWVFESTDFNTSSVICYV